MKLKLLIISILSTLVMVLIQEYNIYKLENSTSVKNGMLTSADEPSYLAPAINFYNTGLWKDNSIGYSSYYQRPPGYGALYYFCYLISNKHSFAILKIIQILLFGISVYLFGLICKLQITNRWLIYGATLVYGVFPCFSSFTYFTITEGVTPFLIILCTYQYLKTLKSYSTKHFVLMGLFIGLSVLVRPQLFFFLIPILMLGLRKYKTHCKGFSLSILIACLPFCIWMIRNYTVNNEMVGIHPIYHTSNNQMYRPIHREMSNLFRIWEYQSDKFHGQMGRLFTDTSAQTRVAIYKEISPKINLAAKYKHQFLSVFKQYQLASYQLKTNYKRDYYLTKNDLPQENKAIADIKQLKRLVKSKNFWRNNIITPFNSLKKSVLSSYLSLTIFQREFRGNLFIECLRYTCFFFLFLGFISLFLIYFSRKKVCALRLLAFGVFAYLFYLFYLQRMNEDRYYYIILPLLLLFLTQVVEDSIIWLKRREKS